MRHFTWIRRLLFQTRHDAWSSFRNAVINVWLVKFSLHCVPKVSPGVATLLIRSNQYLLNLQKASLLRSHFNFVFHFLLKLFISSLRACCLMIDTLQIALLITQNWLFKFRFSIVKILSDFWQEFCEATDSVNNFFSTKLVCSENLKIGTTSQEEKL